MEQGQPTTTETSPLLGSRDPDANPCHSSPSVEATSQHADAPQPENWVILLYRRLDTWSTLYLCGLFILLVDIPAFMGQAPKIRMLELGLCRDFYSASDPSVIEVDGSIPEHLCKVREVQSSLAKLRGFLGMLEGLPGLALAVPYGILADAQGRKLVAGISLLGMIAMHLCTFVVLYFYNTFSVWAVYTAPAFLLVGGGSTVISAVVLAMIADASPEETRTQAFFYVNVAILVSELVSPPFSSFLMEYLGPHFAFFVGIPLEALGFLALLFIREAAPKSGNLPNVEQSSANGADSDEAAPAVMSGTKQRLLGMLSFIRRDIGSLLVQRSLLIGLLSLIVQKMARPILELILQYMSVRFRWPLSRTSFLLSIQAAVQIPLFILLLPQTYLWLLRRKMHATTANLALARACILFLALGSLGMALAPVAPVFIIFMIAYTFGNGYAHAMRSFLTSLVSENRIAFLYTTMSLFEGVAVLLASPLLGLSFSAGLERGGLAVALPFFIAAGLYSLGGLGAWSIDSRHRVQEQ